MDLQEIRKELDKLDSQLVKLLAERLKLIHKVAEYKKNNNLGIHHPEREAELIKAKRELAEELNVNPNLVEEVFKLILKESKEIQKDLI